MGSSGGNASNEALAYEQQRQAQIKATQRAIESAFTTPQREADIQDFLKATRGYYRQDADQQQGDAARQLRFALARTGQTGGRYDIDTNQRLAETYQRGLLEADRRAQSSASALRNADTEAKMRLFQMAASGLDTTTALQNSAQALRQNLEQTRADAREGGLGDLFARFGDIYASSQKAAEERKAQTKVYNTLYQPNTYAGGYGAPRQ